MGKPFADPARRHNATQAVLNAVRTYGAAHADSYGDVRDNNGQVVASFTGDLDEHLAQLQSLVSNPASVAVEQAACSSAYLATITSAIRERFAGDPRRVLWRTANGSVGLRAPFEHLAAELHAEYGDVLKITVGSKPYPPTKIPAANPVPLPSSTIDLPALRITFDPESGTVIAGEDLYGMARLTNVGAGRIAFTTSNMLTAGVRRHGDDYLAGGFTGALASDGFTGRPRSRREPRPPPHRRHDFVPARLLLRRPSGELRDPRQGPFALASIGGRTGRSPPSRAARTLDHRHLVMKPPRRAARGSHSAPGSIWIESAAQGLRAVAE